MNLLKTLSILICIPVGALAGSKDLMSILNNQVVQSEIRKLELKMDFGPLIATDLKVMLYRRQFTSITIKKSGTLETSPPIEQYAVEARRRDGALCTLHFDEFVDGQLVFKWDKCETVDESAW